MGGLKDIVKIEDKSERQLVFFYEMCKLGIVRFDLNNVEHIKLLTSMVETVNKNNEQEITTEEELEILNNKNTNQLHYLIIRQLIKNVIPTKES